MIKMASLTEGFTYSRVCMDGTWFIPFFFSMTIH